MKLIKYYRNAILIPSISFILLSLAYSIFVNHNHSSEWIKSDLPIAMVLITSIVISFIISLVSLTILLNNISIVRNTKILSFFSWFLLPIIFLIIILYPSIIISDKNDYTFLIFPIILSFPYIIGLTISYLKYRQTREKEK